MLHKHSAGCEVEMRLYGDAIQQNGNDDSSSLSGNVTIYFKQRVFLEGYVNLILLGDNIKINLVFLISSEASLYTRSLTIFTKL